MNLTNNLNAGDKVCYDPLPGKKKPENGIIKEIHPTIDNCAWIVFHCGGDWDNYAEYTGALTSLSLVKKGWV